MLVIQEMQIKTTLIYLSYSLDWQKLANIPKLEKRWIKAKSYILLVRIQIGTVTLKFELSFKLKAHIPYNLAILILYIHFTEILAYVHQ